MIINVLDFETASTKAIFDCKCDYCGSQFSRAKRSIVNGRKVVQKDACSNCTQLKIEESNLIKYGTKFTAQLPTTLEKAKQTNLAKYGVEHAGQAEEVKAKIKQTNLEKYGSETYYGSQKFRDQGKAAALERYGVDNFSKAREIKDKIIANTDYEAVSIKKRATCLERYGETTYTKTAEGKAQRAKTIQEKYDGPILKVPEFQEKYKKTNLERYGFESYSQTDEFKQKYMNTCMDKFGVPCTLLLNKPDGKQEIIISEWLATLGFNFHKDHKILDGKEIDLYNEELKLGIEYCGLFWHNELSPDRKNKNYHFNKYKKCLDKGVFLITLFEDEWLTRQNQCKNVIKSHLGIYDTRIFARKCKVEEIDKTIYTPFLNEYHLQGVAKRNMVGFGLFYNDELIGVMTLGHHHRKQTESVVLNRMCFKDGVQVVGGASKLFAACYKWANKPIISWSDNRWSQGNVYAKLGFKLEAELSPDYSYVNLHDCRYRVSKQSQKKSNTNCPADKTEHEWALENDLARIWDCGKKRWMFSPF